MNGTRSRELISWQTGDAPKANNNHFISVLTSSRVPLFIANLNSSIATKYHYYKLLLLRCQYVVVTRWYMANNASRSEYNDCTLYILFHIFSWILLSSVGRNVLQKPAMSIETMIIIGIHFTYSWNLTWMFCLWLTCLYMTNLSETACDGITRFAMNNMAN